jgi:hypothetical protein
MVKVQDLIAALAHEGFEVKEWSKGGLWRLYFDAGRKDATVYLTLDSIDANRKHLTGAALRVHVDRGSQTTTWADAIVRARFMPAFNCYVRLLYPDPTALEGLEASMREMIRAAYKTTSLKGLTT